MGGRKKPPKTTGERIQAALEKPGALDMEVVSDLLFRMFLEKLQADDGTKENRVSINQLATFTESMARLRESKGETGEDDIDALRAWVYGHGGNPHGSKRGEDSGVATTHPAAGRLRKRPGARQDGDDS